jgi:hypothetical protein
VTRVLWVCVTKEKTQGESLTSTALHRGEVQDWNVARSRWYLCRCCHKGKARHQRGCHTPRHRWPHPGLLRRRVARLNLHKLQNGIRTGSSSRDFQTKGGHSTLSRPLPLTTMSITSGAQAELKSWLAEVSKECGVDLNAHVEALAAQGASPPFPSPTLLSFSHTCALLSVCVLFHATQECVHERATHSPTARVPVRTTLTHLCVRAAIWIVYGTRPPALAFTSGPFHLA